MSTAAADSFKRKTVSVHASKFFNFPSDFPLTTSIFPAATILEIWIPYITFRIYIYSYQKISSHLQGDPLLPTRHLRCISFWHRFLVQDTTVSASGLIPKNVSRTKVNVRPGGVSVLPPWLASWMLFGRLNCVEREVISSSCSAHITLDNPWLKACNRGRTMTPLFNFCSNVSCVFDWTASYLQ